MATRDLLDYLTFGVTTLAAVGTFAAVLAALWIASRSNKQLHADAMSRARLVPARIFDQLSAATHELQEIAVGREFRDQTDPDEAKHLSRLLSRTVSYFLRDHYEVSFEQLVALSPLPNAAAHRIARAYGLLDQARFSVQTSTSFVPKGLVISDLGKRPLSKRRLDYAFERIDLALDLLTTALRECEIAQESGAPLPTRQELYGDEE